jgi:hypothetical protein
MSTTYTKKTEQEIESLPYAKLDQEIEAFMQSLGVKFSFRFIPFSVSRKRNEKNPSLNFEGTLTRGKERMSALYSMGCAHCEAYKASVKVLGGKNCVDRHNAILGECETGKKGGSTQNQYVTWERGVGGEHKLPLADLAASLALDSEVINYLDFEEWASDFGYDPDSRKHEAIYQECIKTAKDFLKVVGSRANLEYLQTLARYR